MHVRRALRAGRNTLTGWAMIATLTSLAVAVLFVAHVIVGRRSVHG
jgi:hypothetical protein